MIFVNNIVIDETKILWATVDNQAILFPSSSFTEDEKKELVKYIITVGFEGGVEKSFYGFSRDAAFGFVDKIMKNRNEDKK